MMELSSFKYKRRCSIFKEDFESEEDNILDDQQDVLDCLSPGVKKEFKLNNNDFTPDVNSDVSIDLARNGKRKFQTNLSEPAQSSNTTGEATSEKYKSGIKLHRNLTISRCRKTDSPTTNLLETTQDLIDTAYSECNGSTSLATNTSLCRKTDSPTTNLLETTQDLIDTAYSECNGSTSLATNTSLCRKTDSPTTNLLETTQNLINAAYSECNGTTILATNTSQNENIISYEDADVKQKLEESKGMFDSGSSDDVLLDALRDTNSVDHAVSVLDFSGNKQEESNPKNMVGTGKNGLTCKIDVPAKRQKHLASDECPTIELSGSEDEMPSSKLRKHTNNEDTASAKNREDCWVDSPECRIVVYRNHKKSLKKLKNHFPDYKDEELLSVLESNGGCVDNAFATMEAFSSPKKTACNKKRGNEVIIVDDDDDDDWPVAKKKNRQAAEVIMSSSSDDDQSKVYVHSGGEDQDCEMSFEEKAEVVSFLDSSDTAEIALVRGCSLAKAGKIAKLRPFNNWNDLVEKFEKTRGLNVQLLYESFTIVNERNKMEHLINECETISNDLKGLFEVAAVESEEPSECRHQLVTKERHRTEEPSIVAPGFKLKPYQIDGLNWLIVIHMKGLNGILADEMGLGKTIQAIVFLAHLIEQGDTGPYLIVVPSSTCDNWKRELGQWCPSIQCLQYDGSQEERRAIRDQVNYETEHDFQIILTTYSMATSSKADLIFLRKLRFHYGVFDEAHMLKNMKSQRYQSLLRIQPSRMLLLTGTPIQNNLLELMSLLNFLMPTMFADKVEGIKMLFSNDKTKVKNESAYQKERVIQVKRIMEPFVMRRLKKDVLTQLPAKCEHVINIEMPERHRKVYKDAFVSCAKIVNSADGSKTSVAAKLISGICMKLRKAANHPLLMRTYYDEKKLSEIARKYCRDPSHRDCDMNLVFEDMEVMSDFELRGLCLKERCLKEYELPHELVMESGKFLYFDSILPKMKKNGDRVLMFNQFTMMMDIVEIYLKARNYQYLRLDGSTIVSERQHLIDRFNTDDDIFVFLLSTKAGGLGINLTSANVVILSDLDFNPHNDKQAEDRCHRLGQTREVNVYKLITKESIEEAILKLADDKIRLHEDISQFKEGYKDSDTNDIQSLTKAVFALHNVPG